MRRHDHAAAGAPPGNDPAPAVGQGGGVERLLSGSTTSTVRDDTGDRRRDGYRRIVLGRYSAARCLTCKTAWTARGGSALASAVRHTKATGHATRGSYASDFAYEPANGAR